MSRTIIVCLAAVAISAAAASAQEEAPSVPAEQKAKQLPRQKLSGPRFGFTAFTGAVADQRNQAGLEALMGQFGWQWETQIVSLENRSQALMEWVFLVGGLEQSELNTSLAWITGYRLENGIEFGVGPNISYSRDAEQFTTSMQVAGGATIPFGDLYVPVNVAVGAAKGGPRLTVLMGWIAG